MIALAVGLAVYLLIGCFVANDLLMYPIGRWQTPLLCLFLIVFWLPICARMIWGSWMR